MSVEVREIVEWDVEGFREALDSVAREKRYLASFAAPPVEDVHQFIASGIAANVPRFVAVDGDRVVGWIGIRPGTSITERHSGLLGMGIVSEYRGQGIGERLLAACVAKARGDGMVRISLHVRSDNARAISLYTKAGFRIEGVMSRAMRFEDGFHDALLMSLVDDSSAPEVGT